VIRWYARCTPRGATRGILYIRQDADDMTFAWPPGRHSGGHAYVRTCQSAGPCAAPVPRAHVRRAAPRQHRAERARALLNGSGICTREHVVLSKWWRPAGKQGPSDRQPLFLSSVHLCRARAQAAAPRQVLVTAEDRSRHTANSCNYNSHTQRTRC
jgi:hypothetical protein